MQKRVGFIVRDIVPLKLEHGSVLLFEIVTLNLKHGSISLFEKVPLNLKHVGMTFGYCHGLVPCSSIASARIMWSSNICYYYRLDDSVL
jgi:hypothetical protein